jgi:hypothetical protein
MEFRRAGGIGGVILAVVFCSAVVLMDVLPIEPLPYRRGQYVPQDIRARLAFRRLSDELVKAELESIASRTPATFTLRGSVLDEIVADLTSLPDRLKATSQPADVDASLRKQFAIDSAADLRTIHRFQDPNLRRPYEGEVEQLREELRRTLIVTRDAAQAQHARTATGVILDDGRDEVRVDIGKMIGLNTPDLIRNEVQGRLADGFHPAIRPHVTRYLILKLNQGPLYIHDAEATEEAIERHRQAVLDNPPEDLYRSFAAGDVLVQGYRAGMSEWGEGGLDDEALDLLSAEHRAYLDSLREADDWAPLWRVVGRTAVLLSACMLLFVYVVRYQPHLIRDLWQGVSVTALLLLTLALSKLLVQMLHLDPYVTVLAVLTASYTMTIAYGRRFSLTIAAVISAFVVLQLRGDMAMLITLLAGSTTSIFLLGEVRTRTKLIRVSAVAGGVVFVMIWANSLARGIPWEFALIDSLYGLTFALLSGFLTQGMLPTIERVFNTVTSMTLLEWCDASKPLLKHLAMEAPGTYNHSLQLGTICEAAADRIGARGLLARVGAYYHDIGKTNKAEYFVENQAGGANKHAKLSPAMSLLVIIGHVKDGLELAREYALPKVLHEFIATHHGTTLVQYFYHSAAEKRKGSGDRPPDEVEFRYPGPKPQEKESAILMLADACESSVRAMHEPTPGRIENQVHTMVTRRLMDGQLDECSLTLQEVHAIEESIIKSLCSIYHTRISYPTPAGEKPSAGEAQAAKQEKAEKDKADQAKAQQEGQPDPAPSADGESSAPSSGPGEAKPADQAVTDQPVDEASPEPGPEPAPSKS